MSRRRRRGVAVAGLLAALTLTRAAAGPGSRALDDLVVIQQDGGLVGPVVGVLSPGVAGVLIEDAGEIFLLVVSGNRVLGSSATVVFTDPDCQTAPFLTVGQNPTADLTPLSGVGPGQTLFTESGLAAELMVAARWNLSLDPAACEPVPAAPQLVLPGAARLDLSQRFKPPYRLGPPPRDHRARPVPRLVDGAAATVGRVVGIGGFPVTAVVSLPLEGGTAYVSQARTGGPGGSGISGSYLTADCTGPALVAVGLPGTLPDGFEPFGRATALGKDGLLLIQAGPLGLYDVGSSWDPLTSLCTLAGTQMIAAPAEPLPGYVFTPPFDLVLAGPGASGERGRRDVAVAVDATGAVIGPVFLDFSSPNALVAVTVGTQVALVVAAASQLAGQHTAFFASTDCSGPALMELPASLGIMAPFPLFLDTVLDADGLVRAPRGAAVPTVVASKLLSSLPRACESFGPTEKALAATTPVAHLPHVHLPITAR